MASSHRSLALRVEGGGRAAGAEEGIQATISQHNDHPHPGHGTMHVAQHAQLCSPPCMFSGGRQEDPDDGDGTPVLDHPERQDRTTVVHGTDTRRTHPMSLHKPSYFFTQTLRDLYNFVGQFCHTLPSYNGYIFLSLGWRMDLWKQAYKDFGGRHTIKRKHYWQEHAMQGHHILITGASGFVGAS